MAAYTLPKSLPLSQRLLFSVPLLGRMAKEVTYGDADNIYYALLTLVSAWGCAFVTFGLPGLYVPALLLVPVVLLALVLLSRG